MARRISASAINWSAMSERIPPAQKNNFAAFKMKSDSYLRRVLANPAEPPKIDWAFYKNNVPIAGMVDTFQKQYEALKVPYPADTFSSQLDAQASEAKQAIAQFAQESNTRIQQNQADIAKISALLPYADMTMEDFAEAHPDQAWDPAHPTFWPHETREIYDDSILEHSEDH